MAISESQLETWSHQGSKIQSADTYKSIRGVLNDPGAPYHRWKYRIFLQGSYGNDTNIYADSDVDIVICLTSVYYDTVRHLTEGERTKYKADWSAGDINFVEFKAHVLSWLTSKFGSGVRSGKKAIFVPGNGNRRDADVLVCVEHRTYTHYQSSADNAFQEGICFWTSSGVQVVNYPRQHLDNCTTKNRDTSGQFKKNVRIIKNIRNTMIGQGAIKADLAPSYFLEGMLWNVPELSFTGSYQQTFANYMNWLQQASFDDLMCANNIHFLLRDGHSVCWNVADFKAFHTALVSFWNQS